MHILSPKSWFGRFTGKILGKSLGGITDAAHAGFVAEGLSVAGTIGPHDDFEFFGRHLMASYAGCDPLALTDHGGLMNALRNAIKASGATLLGELSHEFTPTGMTAIMLLSESHASIHTYPEHQACFVDLFTCGRSCSAERFDAVLREHLRPLEARHRIVLRHRDGTDDTSPASCDAWAA